MYCGIAALFTTQGEQIFWVGDFPVVLGVACFQSVAPLSIIGQRVTVVEAMFGSSYRIPGFSGRSDFWCFLQTSTDSSQPSLLGAVITTIGYHSFR